MTEAQYRDATFSLVVVVHALTLACIMPSFFVFSSKNSWTKAVLIFTLIVTLTTGIMFILGWTGEIDGAKI